MSMKAGLIQVRHALWSVLVEQRLFVCVVFALAFGTALNIVTPFPDDNPFLRYVEQMRPMIFLALLWTYRLFLYTTPFILLSTVTSLAYIHGSEKSETATLGKLPPYPQVEDRNGLFAVIGEVHNQLDRKPASAPQWLMIPERGLYTGIAVFGSIGSGKTQAVILPLMRQLFGYKARSVAE